MIYLIDAYNVLFLVDKSSKDLRAKREDLIESFSTYFHKIGLSAILIFDGSHRADEESGKRYVGSLEIVFTHSGQSADAFIVQEIEQAKNPKEITVVTNDQGIKRHAKAMQAHVKSCHSFIRFLEKKSEKPLEEKRNPRDSQKNFNRLLKAFEDRLGN